MFFHRRIAARPQLCREAAVVALVAEGTHLADAAAWITPERRSVLRPFCELRVRAAASGASRLAATPSSSGETCLAPRDFGPCGLSAKVPLPRASRKSNMRPRLPKPPEIECPCQMETARRRCLPGVTRPRIRPREPLRFLSAAVRATRLDMSGMDGRSISPPQYRRQGLSAAKPQIGAWARPPSRSSGER